MTRPGPVRSVGDVGILIDTVDAADARRVAASVRTQGVVPGTDVVCGIRSVLVVFRDPLPDPGRAVAEMADLLADTGSSAVEDTGTAGASNPAADPPADVVIPTVFDGADLDDVASLVGVPAVQVVDALAHADLRVAAVGFSPGFAYLSGVPDLLATVPRRDVPRSVVPAGSVALANGFAAVYPQATPGGWQLLGHTTCRLFDPTIPPFALLRPGDRVQIRPVAGAVAHATGDRLGEDPLTGGETGVAGRSPVVPPPGVATAVVVERSGLLTTVQDGGRPGHAHLGVPPSGPADPVAHQLANALVGNPPGAAALEVTALGPALRFRRAGHVAVVGGDVEILLDGFAVGANRVVPVAAGQQLSLGRLRSGARAYLAVAGGFVVPDVLGSRASDTFTGMGPGVLHGGDTLGVGSHHGPLGDHLHPDAIADLLVPTHELRVLAGPDVAWFGPGLAAQLAATWFVAGPESDRVGLRLHPSDGAAGLDRLPGEIESRGMVAGAVQVPPSGEPVVLMPDHPTLGGYPVAAVVITADRGRLGQCRPGDSVRLVPVEPDEARAANEHLARVMARALVGRYPGAAV
jgi:KipI family sensor histidine kinase inhibitor